MNLTEKYLTEAKVNMMIHKKFKNIINQMIGLSRTIKTGDFPWDDEANIKEGLQIEITGYKMMLDDILKSVA
jgi:hypothetical protein